MSECARDIMTPRAESVGENETLLEAARKMAQLDIGSLPICGEDERLRGLITDRDIVVKVVAERLDPGELCARDLAQGNPVTVSVDTPINQVISKMKARKVRRLPVVDEDQKLVGIVSQTDLTRLATRKASERLVHGLRWAD